LIDERSLALALEWDDKGEKNCSFVSDSECLKKQKKRGNIGQGENTETLLQGKSKDAVPVCLGLSAT